MDSDDSYTDVLRAKVVTMVVLFCASMATGCLPLLITLKFDWFTKSVDGDLKSNNKMVVGLLSFGGGVLFATSFLHLLPEVDENIHLLVESGQLPELEVHLAGLIMCSGFFMMYMIEELVHSYIESRETKNDTKTSFTRTLSIRKKSDIPITCGNEDILEKNLESVVEVTENKGDAFIAALRGLLIVLALSIHELFEGLAVGLESSAANVWYMFGAVSAHKYIIAFCIGVELIAAKTKKWLSVVYIFTFSFVSALGIGIGILLVGGSGATEAGIYSVVLQGIACGTLVYVVFFEVWGKDKSGFINFFCAVSGFGIMAMLEWFVGWQ